MLELVARSRFKAAVVIPVYNHPATVETLVLVICKLGLPCIIVDDGSDPACARLLDDVSQRHGAPATSLIRLATNQGKGGAVMAGLREASRQGFSHAVQIDADGQHDPFEVANFLSRSKRHPAAVICGCPIYDASAPPLRRFGRYATRVWVWINTLSFAIGDSMCGLRVYPLQSVVPLIDEVALGRRMDFDTEVLVRLHWRGVEVLNQNTRVTYPADGISHFRMGLDNGLLALMHARLFFGMLRRAPALIWRRLETSAAVRKVAQ